MHLRVQTASSFNGHLLDTAAACLQRLWSCQCNLRGGSRLLSKIGRPSDCCVLRCQFLNSLGTQTMSLIHSKHPKHPTNMIKWSSSTSIRRSWELWVGMASLVFAHGLFGRLCFYMGWTAAWQIELASKRWTRRDSHGCHNAACKQALILAYQYQFAAVAGKPNQKPWGRRWFRRCRDGYASSCL